MSRRSRGGKRPGLSILLVLAMLVGMVFPVPDCFVTRLACPLKKNQVCQDAGAASVPCPAHMAPDSAPAATCPAHAGSCSVPGASGQVHPAHRAAGESVSSGPHITWTLADLRLWMKPFAPERMIAKAPVLPVSIGPALFHTPVSPTTFVSRAEHALRRDLPDPIPILLRKQSFLI